MCPCNTALCCTCIITGAVFRNIKWWWPDEGTRAKSQAWGLVTTDSWRYIWQLLFAYNRNDVPSDLVGQLETWNMKISAHSCTTTLYATLHDSYPGYLHYQLLLCSLSETYWGKRNNWLWRMIAMVNRCVFCGKYVKEVKTADYETWLPRLSGMSSVRNMLRQKKHITTRWQHSNRWD